MTTPVKEQPKWLWPGIYIASGVCVTLVLGLLIFLLVKSSNPAPADVSETQPIRETVSQTKPPTDPAEPTLDLEPSLLTAEDFTYRGQYLTCTAVPCKIGVDVSSWQEEITWELVSDVGMEFAMIRMAWRGNTEGGISEDRRARENYEGARKAGLLVGGYFFSQAITPEEAVEEAEFLLEMIKDWQIDMPIVYDWERSENRTANTDAQTVTDCAKAFCQTIEEAGYEAMVYFNLRQAYNEMYLEELEDYGFWLAQYNDEITFPYAIDMWQYTSSGSVLGIDTSVDLNLWFTD